MLPLLFLSFALIIILFVGSMAYKYYSRYTTLQRDYRDACKLIDSISNAYYNQYGKAYSEK